ncbi:hypothetical protein NBRC116494_22820 [Aurantivibrio plasticivorans]
MGDAQLRAIVCHKHPSSGRLTFLQFASGNICGPLVLPRLSVISDLPQAKVVFHPSIAVRQVAEHLQLPEQWLMLMQDFKLFLEVPKQYASGGLLPVFLVMVVGRDLPNVPYGHSWIELPDGFSLPYLEREILREAYRHVM